MAARGSAGWYNVVAFGKLHAFREFLVKECFRWFGNLPFGTRVDELEVTIDANVRSSAYPMLPDAMTTTRFPRFLPLFAVLLANSTAEIPEADLGAFLRPAADQGGSFAAEQAKGVVAEIVKTGSFAKWKTFEDERVKFLYPDHEAVTVEVKTDEPVPVDGDRVSDVDTSFSRAYRLTAGGETLTVLMLKDGAEWFDDGICLCGEIVYDRYLVRDGRFYRFGFLEDGVMKKMEVLGDRERLMMFEWTHSPIHPEVYRKIARSV
jgi:hypothetical protein